MTGFFEHFAATDTYDKTVSRKAVALARARANTRFAKFLDASRSVDEREARLALVAGELEETVRQACADVDYPAWENVLESVQSHMGMVVESRRPKMCPYHSEVTDISLASGDPQSGFSAMAQHAWGQNHCKGEYDGRCNFKPEMTTQSYWDQKQQQNEDRRQQRQLQQEEQFQSQPMQSQPEQEVEEFDSGEADNSSWADEPSAVGMGTEPAVAEPAMAMAASRRTASTPVANPVIHGGSRAPLAAIEKRMPGVVIDGQPFAQWDAAMKQQEMAQGAVQLPQVTVQHPNPVMEDIIARCLQSGSGQPLKQWLAENKAKKEQGPGGPPGGPGMPPPGGPPSGPGAPPGPMSSVRQAEALETVDVTKGGETAFPKMKKEKWTPQNVSWDVDQAEMSGTPNPTVHQDINEPIGYTGSPFADDGRFDQTDAVLEKQDVTKGSDFSNSYSDTWANSGGGRSAVSGVKWGDEVSQQGNGEATECSNCGKSVNGETCANCGTKVAAIDPDKNPIRESLLSEEEAQEAIRIYNQEA